MKWLRSMSNLVGLNPRVLLALRFLPRYLSEARRFRSAGGVIDEYFPVLGDYADSAGMAKGHYFYQDLLVAQKIFLRNPKRHVDIGSRVDGFVAHVASFREIELFDIRPLKTGISNIHFRVQDLLDLPVELHEYADSVSCLHALEHFGLGRYGDPIDPRGYETGFNNLLALSKPEGMLYVSVPVGCKRTAFNAHRIFSPFDLAGLSTGKALLKGFSYIDDLGELHTGEDIPGLLSKCEKLDYGLGIYEFKKLS